MAKTQPKISKHATKDDKKSSKAPLVAGAIGLAIAGGAGGYAYHAATTANTGANTAKFAELPEPDYTITKYKLRQAKQRLASLAVRTADEAQRQYNDNGFVPKDWADLDGNGCKTRYDILFSNLAGAINDDAACSISSGLLFDYYTGKIISYDQSSSGGGIDIDHVVSKKNAWNSGGYAWDQDKWEEYANDRNVLIAVSASENRSKGDKDAADWLVPNNPAFQCQYVVRQIEIKTTYGLSVRQPEKSIMDDVLVTKCQTK